MFSLSIPRVFLLKPAARDPQSWCFTSSFQQKNLGAFLRVCLKMVFLVVYSIVYPQVRPYFSRENDDKPAITGLV